MFGTISKVFPINRIARKRRHRQLHQFLTVAKAGSVKRAREQLRLAPQTPGLNSGQPFRSA